MKKSLLFLSAAAIATMANAQQVVVGLATSDDFAAVGLESTKADHDPCTIVDNEAGTFGLAYADSWGTATTYKNYRNVTVNGEAIQLGSGAVGNTNPSFISFEAGCQSAGAVFKYTAKMDGYMTVFTKINPNKQYVVYEGTVDGAIVYSVGWSNGTQKIYYAYPGDEDGLIDFNAPDISKYVVAATQQVTNEAGQKAWQSKTDPNDIVYADAKPSDDYQPYNEIIPGATKPAMPWNVAGFESAPGESLGFVSFHVWEDMDYYFSALGSKAACGGFVFTESEPTVVFEEVLADDGTVSYPRVEFPAILGAGVESVSVESNENAPIYNLMGVRVNSDAKGILLQNGKKFIRK